MRAIARFAASCGAVAIVAVLAVFAPAMGADAAHTLTWADNQDISSLNTFLATSANIEPLSELTMAEFTRFDAAGNAIPELVTAIPTKANHGVSADGTTITWHLRHGVQWSDGAPFDASDVTYTYRVATDPNNNIAAREIWNRLRAVDAPDPYTVVFHFKAPYALFVQDYFSIDSTTCILPKHVLGPGTAINDAPYNALPVGIGPFRYTAYHRGDAVEMEANPYYWRGKPKLQKVVYKIITDENTLFTQLQTGELDLWDTINGALAQRVKTLAGHRSNARLSIYMESIFFNTKRPIVNDPRVRAALELAVNRPLIFQRVALGNGVLAQSVVPKMAEGALNLPLATYDPARAGRLLDAAGWKRGPDGMRSKDGKPLAVELAVPSGQPTRETTAAVLHDEWTAIGVAVTIHDWAASEYFAPASAGGTLQTGKYDAALAADGSGPLYANINGSYDCASVPPNGFNLSAYCNPHLDARNDRYLASFERAERVPIAATMQRTIDADTPAIVLYERSFVSAYDAHLTGYHPSAFSYWGDPLQLDR